MHLRLTAARLRLTLALLLVSAGLGCGRPDCAGGSCPATEAESRESIERRRPRRPRPEPKSEATVEDTHRD